jgi:hypothetical protein
MADGTTPENVRGRVAFTLGGVDRHAFMTIERAIEIEEATGRGILALASEVIERRIRVGDMADVFRAVLASEGVHMTRAEVAQQIAVEGIVAHVRTLTMLLGEFMRAPGGGAGNGSAGKRKAIVSR